MERILAIGSTLLLVVFVPVQNYALFAAGVGLFGLVTLWQWRKRRVS